MSEIIIIKTALFMSLLFYLRLTFWSHLFHTRKKSSHSAKRSLIFENQFCQNIPAASWKERMALNIADAVITTPIQFNSIQFKQKKGASPKCTFNSNEAFEISPVGWGLDESKDSRECIGESCPLFKDDRWEIVYSSCAEYNLVDVFLGTDHQNREPRSS